MPLAGKSRKLSIHKKKHSLKNLQNQKAQMPLIKAGAGLQRKRASLYSHLKAKENKKSAQKGHEGFLCV